MQCDLGNFNPAGTYSSEDFGREVQAGGRRCYRSPRLGVDGLVALPVRRAVFTVAPAVNVGRKGDVSNALDSGKEIGDWGESDEPLAKTAAVHNFRFQCGWRTGWSVKVEFFSDPDLPAGSYQALPLIRILGHLACQQNFDPSAEEISCCGVVRAYRLGELSAAVAVEPGREDPCIVYHQQVIRSQQVGEVAETPILPTTTPIQVQQARSGAVCQRLLRNAIGRQIVLEVGD